MMYPFKKMHGLGNDFIMMNGQDLPSLSLPILQALAKDVCDRHFGIGADGLIIVAPPSDASFYDLRFIYINSDGSMAEMCGNGIRCFARYVIDEGVWQSSSMRVETGAGLIQPMLTEDGQIRVNMGCPIVETSQVPFIAHMPYEAGKAPAMLNHDGDCLSVWPVSMGNPHAILFLEDGANSHLNPQMDGHLIETHLQFPAKTNVEFTTQIDAQTYQVTVWERGCGFTHACGTGACATAVAAVASGRADANVPVEIRLPGGALLIEWSGDYDSPVWMTGPATTTCSGVLDAQFAHVFQVTQGTATHA